MQLLCVIVEDEADCAAFKDYVGPTGPIEVKQAKQAVAAAATPKPKSPPPAAAAQVSAPSSIPSRPASTGIAGRLFASPLARRLASEQGLDLSSVGGGSGPGGRIVAADLGRAVVGAAARTGQLLTDIQLTGMRRAIAKRLTESKQTIPHYYLVVDVVIDELLR